MLSARLFPPSAGESHQRSIAGAAADVIGVELFAGSTDVVDDDAAAPGLHLRVDLPREVDVAEHFQFPGVPPGGFIDLVDGAAGDVAGIVDEHVDVGGVLGEPRDILGLAQVHDARRGIDLVCGSQPVGQRLELLAATGSKQEMRTLFGKRLGGGCANALGRACDQDALATQMQIHKRYSQERNKDEISRRTAAPWSTLQCSVALPLTLVHCSAVKKGGGCRTKKGRSR